MSKFSNLLKLLTLLKSHKRMKKKEIAQALGVSEMMVRKYISDLQEANINIKSISGPNGGYELNGYDYLINLNINNNELVALELALNELKIKNPKYINDLESLTDKIKINNDLLQDNYNSNISQLSSMYLDKENDYELELQSACITRNKVRIKYHSISSGDSIRIVRPYTIITRNNLKYLIAYCEKRQSVRTFKLVRIKEIDVLLDKFEPDSNFNIKEYMKNTIGLFNEEEIDLKLYIRKPFSYSVSEHIYVENQKIKWNMKDESIIFEAKINGKKDIVRWILSMGDSVTILEPVSLKEEIKSILKNMIELI